jgi:hypothetical protein
LCAARPLFGLRFNAIDQKQPLFKRIAYRADPFLRSYGGSARCAFARIAFQNLRYVTGRAVEKTVMPLQALAMDMRDCTTSN